MTLRTGARIGPYEIVGVLGAGGMGEVYRARDTSLQRDAALKVLPEALAADADGLARLRREAQLLAALSHPNVASIYGLEEADGVVALALELVDGEDLAERLARGPLGLEEAVECARQIADGLEAAHAKGIVHRDLKPANLKLASDGRARILDFGLAKDDDGGAGAVAGDPSQSPTLARSLTSPGVVIGTAAYMSPEQARGQRVDERSDVWAFGVVLFEMLTGRRLFAEETLSDTLVAVLTREPDWARLPAATPPSVRRLLRRCLERDPKRRLRAIADARLELNEAFDPWDTGAPAPGPVRRRLPWGVAVAALVLSGWLALAGRAAHTPLEEPTHVEIALPADVEPAAAPSQGPIALSPDGRSIAATVWRKGVRQILLRRLDEPEGSELSGTAGINAVAFSPDGRELAFLDASASLRRLALADRQRRLVTPASPTGDLSWTPAGIVFGGYSGLRIVSPEGGPARALTELDAERGELSHDSPLLLPGGRRVLFVSKTGDPAEARIEGVPIEGGPRSVIVERASAPLWAPTGHLLFARDGALLAAPSDPQTGELRGEALPVIPAGVVGRLGDGGRPLALSPNGTLLYMPSDYVLRLFLWVDREGAALPLDLPPEDYSQPRTSPDGRSMLLISPGGAEVLDLSRGTRSRLAAGAGFPTWSADGHRIVAWHFSNGLSWTAADGSADSAALPGAGGNDFPSSPGPDSDSILVVRIQPETSGDVYLLSLSGAFEPRPLIASPAYDGGPQLSPDGRWLIYQSDASGRPEIYVARYPQVDRRWPVSEGGGFQTRWGRDGREIFYRDGRDMVAVAFDGSGAEPSLGTPTPLFPDEYDFGLGISIANYDVAADGRFIMLRRTAGAGRLRLVLGWTHELERILAAGGVH